jgi:hypothetical protein
MTIKNYTFKQIEKMKSLTNWDLKKDEDINLNDLYLPDITELEAKGLVHRMKSPFEVGADGEITIRKRKKVD